MPETTTSIGPLRLQSGAVLPRVDVAFAHYGRLAEDGGNAVLVTHGYTASHRMLAHGDGVAEGSWAPLIGPGKVLDTDRYFIVCSNMLGSSYGTTGPASTDPATGRRYGADFPAFTLADIVEVQHRLLAQLGVRRLRCVVGPSYGGFQALQWAVDHADMVDSIGVIVSAPYLPPSEHMDLPRLEAALAAAPAHGGVEATLKRLRIATMQAYGMEEVLAARGLSPAEREQAIDVMSGRWAQEFDADSLVALLRAAVVFDLRRHLDRVGCRVLHVVASTDKLFPPDQAVQADMAGIRGPCRYLEMQTPFGHQASGPAHALWSGALRELLEGAEGAGAAGAPSHQEAGAPGRLPFGGAGPGRNHPAA